MGSLLKLLVERVEEHLSVGRAESRRTKVSVEQAGLETVVMLGEAEQEV